MLKKQKDPSYAQFAVAMSQAFSLALNLAGGLGNTVTVKCSRGPHGSWL